MTEETKAEIILFAQWLISESGYDGFLPAVTLVENYLNPEINPRGPGKPIKGIYTGGKGRPTK